MKPRFYGFKPKGIIVQGKQFFSVSKAAKELRITRHTVRKLIANGEARFA